jgi:hypothetical protein
MIAMLTACEWSDGRAPHQQSVDAHVTTRHDAADEVDAPHAAACTLLPQDGCSGAEPACDLTAANDGTTTCRAVTAAGAGADHCPASTDCKTGYTCVHDGVTADVPRCMPFCAHDTDCNGVGSRCTVALVDNQGHDIHVEVCSTSCALVAQTGCPVGMGCIGNVDAAGDYTDCEYMGTTANGRTCTSSTDCRPGSDCITTGSISACEAYCVVGGSACATGKTCTDFDPPMVIGGVTFGSCH